jgi:hypothetical protein
MACTGFDMGFISMLYKALRLHNDIRAASRGQIRKRLMNKGIGRVSGKMMRR